MPSTKTHRIKMTRPAPTPGGFSDGRVQHKICDWPVATALPFSSVRVPDDTPLSETWKAGPGPDALGAASSSETPSEINGTETEEPEVTK